MAKESERITKQETTVKSEILEEVRNRRYNIKIAPSDLIDFGEHISFDMTNQLYMPHRGSILLMFGGRFGLHKQLNEYPKGVTAAGEWILKVEIISHVILFVAIGLSCFLNKLCH